MWWFSHSPGFFIRFERNFPTHTIVSNLIMRRTCLPVGLPPDSFPHLNDSGSGQWRLCKVSCNNTSCYRPRMKGGGKPYTNTNKDLRLCVSTVFTWFKCRPFFLLPKRSSKLQAAWRRLRDRDRQVSQRVHLWSISDRAATSFPYHHCLH